MPIHVTWDQLKSNIIVSCEGHWTFDEALVALNQASTLLQHSEQSVCVLIDLTKSLGMPANILSLRELKLPQDQPYRIDALVFSGTTHIHRALIGIGHTLLPKIFNNCYQFRTYDEAINFLGVYQLSMKKARVDTS